MADEIKFAAEYVYGSHAILNIDRWTPDRGDQVMRIIAPER